MQSVRFLLKFKRPPLKHFQEKNTDLKHAIWSLTTGNNYTSFSQPKTGRSLITGDCLRIPISQEVPPSKFFHNVPHNIKSFETPDRQDASMPEYVKSKSKNKSRQISIVTKSNDPDTFGDMEDILIVDSLEDRVGNESNFHEDCEVFIPENRKYRSPRDYFNAMKDLVQERKLKQALELFPEMRKHLVPPFLSHYTLMIGACGKAGYTEMAFKLLKQMTIRGFRPTPATLTGLFNSCAESPNIEYGLKKATYLKEKIQSKAWVATVPTYHAMIKAFGKCGDIGTAFQIVDEMKESGFRISVQTYNTLLITCISDKDAGFTHAIEVWRKMISKKLRPDYFSYNLLLRAARDCGVGPEEVSCNLLQHWRSDKQHLLNARKKTFSHEDVLTLPKFPQHEIKLIGDTQSDGSTPSQEKISSAKKENVTEEKDVIKAVPSTSLSSNSPTSHEVLNILSPRPSDGPEFVDLKNIKHPADRLLLIGGIKGILELMKKDKVSPDIKTFTMLLRILPNSLDADNELLSLMESYQVKPDVDFFNMLIKKVNFRRHLRDAKEVLVLITKAGLRPDIVTFGVLALGCTKKKDGLQLIHDMKGLELCPNIEIFGALLNAASKEMDLDYIYAILKEVKTEGIQPSVKFLQMLEDVRNTAHEKILAMKHAKEIAIPFPEKFYNKFCQLYDHWLKDINVEDEDPLLQYKTEITDNFHETLYDVNTKK